MRRGYAVAFFVVYAACLLMTGYVLSGGLPFLVVVGAFALGPVAWLPVGVAFVFPYLTGLIPAAIAVHKGVRPRFVAAWAAFGLAFVAVGLPLLSQLIATGGLAVASMSNINHGRLPRPKVVEFVTGWRGGTGTYTAPCDALCQQLLTNGEVERVVVAAVRYNGKLVKPTDRVGYRMADRSGPCPATFRLPTMVVPGTLAAASEGRCLVAGVGDTTHADVTVSNRFFAEKPKRVLEISTPSKGVVRRVTAPRYYVLEMPFHLTMVHGGGPFNARLVSAAHRVSGPDTAGAVAGVLGLAVDRAAVEAKPLARRAALEFVLAHPGSASIVKNWDRPFQNTFYSTSFRKTVPLTAKDIRFVHAVLGDMEFANVSSVGSMFSNRRDLSVAEFAPDILRRLEADGQEDKSNQALAHALTRLGNDELKPYADRLLAIARRAAPWSKPIIRKLGQLGTDPAPVLGDLLATPMAGAVIVAMCTADAEWGPAMMPALKAYFAAHGYNNPPDRLPNGLVNGIIALRRFGEKAYVADLLANYPPAVASKVEAAVARAGRLPTGCFGS